MKISNSIKEYFKYCVIKGINIKKDDYVEIVTSTSIISFISILKEVLEEYTNNIYVTFNDGDELACEINNDWELYLNNKIKSYKMLMLNHFKRIRINSPFTMPITRTWAIERYLENTYRLRFLQDYFLINPHTTIAVPNEIWALKLGISIDELWEKIIELSYKESMMSLYKNELNNLGIKYLHFKTSLGTNITFGMNDNFKFLDKNLDNRTFQANIPCLELFTSPNKYDVNGTIVSSKPLYYKGSKIDNYMLIFKDGKLVYNEGLEDIIGIDKTLQYIGEVSIVEGFNPYVFYSTLLDENAGCHIALGEGFKNTSSNTKNINESLKHIDLVFGYYDTEVSALLDDGSEVLLMKDSLFVYRGNK